MIEILDLIQSPDDLTTLARWHQEEWAYLNPGETLAQRITRMQSCLSQNAIPSTYVAREQTLLGSASLVKNDMPEKSLLTPWLASVFVAPEYRKRGVGTKLVTHVMAQAKFQGIKRLYLYTPDKNKFYERLGWRINSTVRYHGYPVSIMQTTLTQAL